MTRQATRFFIDIAKSSTGKRGWQLGELVDGMPHFRAWRPMSQLLALRAHAHTLGATLDSLMIEGVVASAYKCPEGGYALTHEEMQSLGYH